MVSTDTVVANGLLKQRKSKQKIDQRIVVYWICPPRHLSDAAMMRFVRKLHCVYIFFFFFWFDCTALLCGKIQNNWRPEVDIIDQHDWAGFELKMSFGWISYIVSHQNT